MDDPDLATIKLKLAALKTEHRDLDDVIARVQEAQMLAAGPATSFVSASVLPQKEHDRRAVACAIPP